VPATPRCSQPTAFCTITISGVEHSPIPNPATRLATTTVEKAVSTVMRASSTPLATSTAIPISAVARKLSHRTVRPAARLPPVQARDIAPVTTPTSNGVPPCIPCTNSGRYVDTL
jgi:hypothetical protein